MQALGAYWQKERDIAPLATFRVAFGAIMLISIIRFWLNGWIQTQYIDPTYYFTYYGFDWVKPLGNPGMYILFFVIGMAALCMMLGFMYRFSAVIFFLGFTYVELIDKTNYLNHYYFVSIVAFLLILVPANKAYSLDAFIRPKISTNKVPAWTIDIFKLQLGLVYFYAGVAKLNPDWLFAAMPLRIWLPANADLPLIGFLFDYVWVAFAFSWFGALYDLTIPFLLAWCKTRVLAYGAVIAFHILTAILFQIGMFPFIMILATLVFFSETFHVQLWERLGFTRTKTEKTIEPGNVAKLGNKLIIGFLTVHFLVQAFLPWRFLLYPGNLYWTEQGYRFSWRVMLMEKAGYTTFYVQQPDGAKAEVDPAEFLTPVQVKMMSTQPDMILQFAHFLKDYFKSKGHGNVKVYARSYVGLNGRSSKKFIAENVDLTSFPRGYRTKNWILSIGD